jgi:hypothetical protein
MIRRTTPLSDFDLVPQAILARSILYFTIKPFEDTDDLDHFQGAAFTLGNNCHFALRNYRGHPKRTVTLYFEYDDRNIAEVNNLIDEIIEHLQLPKSAVAWRRGESYEFGQFKIHPDRLFEREARILTLKIAATFARNRASTSEIKARVPDYMELGKEDWLPYKNRGVEPRWRQIVGNVSSHRPGQNSIFNLGYAEKTDDGVQVTREGLNYLNSMGFAES